jgi:hypothetical protein
MSTNLTLLIAGGRIVCRRCQAMSKRTGKQCGAPAHRNSKTSKCKWHGGLSSGPKTEQGRKRCAEAKTIHGRETREIRTERSRKSAELHQLVDFGNASGLFSGKVALRGRPPRVVGVDIDSINLEKAEQTGVAHRGLRPDDALASAWTRFDKLR